MNRIDAQLSQRGASGEGAFCPYVCAGDPDLDFSAKLIEVLAENGADSIELGVPFSDPIADGPILQAATQRALSGGVTIKRILRMVRRLRKSCDVPIALMTYYNPIHRHGVEQLVDDAADAGIDGLIVPDLPPEQADELIEAARRRDVKTIFFIAPTTAPERIETINRATTGFLYCLSVAGITGARKELPPDLRRSLEQLKKQTDKPLIVGFGVSEPKQVKQMCEFADGVIVGSALTALMKEHAEDGPDAMLSSAGEFACRMARAAHGD